MLAEYDASSLDREDANPPYLRKHDIGTNGRKKERKQVLNGATQLYELCHSTHHSIIRTQA